MSIEAYQIHLPQCLNWPSTRSRSSLISVLQSASKPQRTASKRLNFVRRSGLSQLYYRLLYFFFLFVFFEAFAIFTLFFLLPAFFLPVWKYEWLGGRKSPVGVTISIDSGEIVFLILLASCALSSGVGRSLSPSAY